METIKSSAEITRLFDTGRRVGTKDLTLIASSNEKQHGHRGRAAFIAGKKLGNAVWRNRAKRRMRAVCQMLGGPLPGYDIVFLARKSINAATFNILLAETGQALEKIAGGQSRTGQKAADTRYLRKRVALREPDRGSVNDIGNR